MFCARCGKTLPENATSCNVCGLNFGDTRFYNAVNTSAQAVIYPGDDVFELYFRPELHDDQQEPNVSEDDSSRYAEGYTHSSYTRTSYTTRPDMATNGAKDERTTYRPAFEGSSIPEDMRSAHDQEEAQAAAEEAEEAGAEVEGTEAAAEESAGDESHSYAKTREGRSSIREMEQDLQMSEIDLSKLVTSPIEIRELAGIDPSITEKIQQLESEPQPRIRLGRRAAAFGDYEEAAQPADETYAEEAYADDTYTAESNPDMVEPNGDFEYADYEEDDELRHTNFNLKRILQILGAIVVVVALCIGGVMWINYIRGTQSSAPIENVGEDLYTQGITLIKSHASTENISKILTDYSSQGSSLTALSAQLQQSAAAVDALLPENATENEQLFMTALKKIETNIANCIISDAMAVSQNDTAAVDASDSRWAVVENSISMLEAADSAAALTAIINGEVIDVQKVEATPTPEPEINYNTLSKGDKSDEVVDMQTRLVDLGYLKETPDGAFGSKTQTAVKIFQQMAGLPVTGIADNATLVALYDDAAPRADANTPAAGTETKSE